MTFQIFLCICGGACALSSFWALLRMQRCSFCLLLIRKGLLNNMHVDDLLPFISFFEGVGLLQNAFLLWWLTKGSSWLFDYHRLLKERVQYCSEF
jgi:hypothetical protein